MFERFTDRARKVLVEAQAEAVETAVGFIGTEHLLMGMLREGTGVAGVVLAQHGITLEPVRQKATAELAEQGHVGRPDRAAALATLGIDLEAVRSAVEAAFGEGALRDPATSPPFTPRARNSLELALAASQRWSQRYIGTEHLLVGLIDEGEGLAVSILKDLGADLAAINDAVKKTAAPEAWRADGAWDDFTALVRRVWELPDGPAKDDLTGRRLAGFQAAAEEQEAIKAAATRFSERLEELNASLREGLSRPG